MIESQSDINKEFVKIVYELNVCYNSKCKWIPVTDRLGDPKSKRIDLSHAAMIYFTGTDYNKIEVQIKGYRKRSILK